jgi:hypothetical protein
MKELANSPLLRNRVHDITIDEIRALETFKNYSDDQVVYLIDTLKAFSGVIYQIVQRQEITKVIPLITNESQKKVA